MTTTGTNIGSNSTFTLSVNTDKGIGNFVISETSYTYMRAKTITFFAQGLKPNTLYYPFFAGSYVGEYCSTQNGQISSPIQTNAQGDITGNFYLPGGTFICGTHTFELVDNVRRDVGGAPIAPDPLYGSLTAQYEAYGSLRYQQTQATSASLLDQTNNTLVSTVNNITSSSSNNSVNIANNITNTVTVEAAAPPVPPIVPPPPTVCEEWWFDYQVVTTTGGGGNQRLTVTVANSAPNPNPWFGDPTYTDVTYITSTALAGGLFEHVYTATVVSRTTTGNRMRQTWQGPNTTATPAGGVAGSGLPVLTNFRPSGLTANDTVNILTQWTRTGTVACPATFGLRAPTRVDPIAQSFFVDPAKHPDGLFVTSIDLFFKTVDQTTPVTLEMRNMSNGLPGSIVLPHGKVVVPGYTTKQSNDASAATKFVFDTPVYVAPGEDYCFVVKSSSLGYNMWCSRMGEPDTLTGKVIDTQPFGGTLFKSENDSTWIPDSYEDVKFVMRHAQFNTTSTANLIFRPQKTSDNVNYAGTSHNLPISFISTVRGSNILTIKCPLHGLITGDRIIIAGLAEPTPATAYNGIPFNRLNGTHQVTVLDGDEFTITIIDPIVPAIKTGPIQARDRYSNIDTTIATLPVLTAPVAADPVINPDTLTPSTLTGALPAPPVPTAPGVTSTTSFILYTNILVNEIMADYMNTKFDSSSINERIRLAEGYTDPTDENVYRLNEYVGTNPTGDFTMFGSPQLIATPTNESFKTVALSNQPSATLDIRMSTRSKDVSPVIDTTGMSLVTRSYKIDNQLDEIDNLRTAVEAGLGNNAGAYSGNGTALWAEVASTAVQAGLLVVSGGHVYRVVEGGTFGSIAPDVQDGASDPILSGTGVRGTVTVQYLQNDVGAALYYKAAYNDDTVGRNSEINAGTGHALAKYKSPINTFDDFYDKLTVFVSANIPRIDNSSHTEIDVYVRTSTDEYTHIDQDWQYCPVDGDYRKTVTPSKTRMTIDEAMFEIQLDQLFNVFDIKIVMRSTNSSYVPKIYGIRAIANKSLV